MIAGREGGVEEVVRDGVTGVLTPARDPGAMAAAIDRLLKERQQASRWAERRRGSSLGSAAWRRPPRSSMRPLRRPPPFGQAGGDAFAPDPPRFDRLERKRPHPGAGGRRPLGQRPRRGRALAPAARLGRGPLARQPAAPRAADRGAARPTGRWSSSRV